MSGSGARHWEQDKEATVYIGNLDERVTDQMVWELMLQAGRIQNVHLPKVEKINIHPSERDANFCRIDSEYASKIMNGVRLYGKPIRVNKASADKQGNAQEVGANLFIGGLDAVVDEKTLYDVFGRFGTLTSVPKIARDEVGASKGYGFISYGDFESSDAAIAHMNGQFLANKEISVVYAYKKDGKGERHGSEAERKLAAEARSHGVSTAVQPLPPALFQAPPAAVPTGPAMMNGDGRGMPGAPSGPAAYGGPPGAPPVGRAPASLPPPPSGLPARPPNAPQNNYYPAPPGFGGHAPPGFGGQPPHGYMGGPPAPPPGFGGAPPVNPPGFPPGPPPAFRR